MANESACVVFIKRGGKFCDTYGKNGVCEKKLQESRNLYVRTISELVVDLAAYQKIENVCDTALEVTEK